MKEKLMAKPTEGELHHNTRKNVIRPQVFCGMGLKSLSAEDQRKGSKCEA
jgi:hypothetical protein